MTATRDHGDPGDSPTIPGPLHDVARPARPTPAEEARTLTAANTSGTLATLTGDGDPWASFVTYGLHRGSPVLCVSHMAEHGRNLANDQRASIAIVTPDADGDPLASGRVTLAGTVVRPVGDEYDAARAAHLDAVPAARYYLDYSDFSLWVLRVHRVRWVGGYGRMDSASGADYVAAEPDPVVPQAAPAVAHLNADHAESLLAMARSLGGYPDAITARCTGADRYGLDLSVTTPRGPQSAPTRVGYARRLDSADELRSATVELAQTARAQGSSL